MNPMTRVSTSARRNLDSPLGEGATGSRFERYVLKPYLAVVLAVSLLAGIVVVVMLLSLK
jgi:hypothetical protein